MAKKQPAKPADKKAQPADKKADGKKSCGAKKK